MGKGGYSGGGTIVGLGENGTFWGSVDEAENKHSGRKRKSSKDARNRKSDGRVPNKRAIKLEEENEARKEAKIVRSFVSVLVKAYSENKLTASEPNAPIILRKRIAAAGGNIKWLERNRNYQILFHQAYCKLIEKYVPFERVWGRRAP